ncbi:N-acetylneuraminate synthase family protein [Clostridium saccharoperbutylacetonicum]|uniref:N-acetylneuraminate synthase family protein n=1 Tax=Clostridium saccharoperbutylacetonicum TaxID=36745 RepID=UPI000983F28E|nr:N-acetylneuraminate synthase family protein [Clostridium saccharoperbutylacetonicum]AQR96981.1 N,N'-diacetyllegionaminic acid synthase [Clostridium saccharoperbutylacetonicum]NSB32860.1 N-acetylneuraminate synthase [Clostridium saccharoperbutylacetonicum]
MLRNYKENRCYIVAEIGGNFTNFAQAKKLIDEAYDCGVDAVKLQTYRADTISSKNAIFDMENTGVISQYDLFKKYEIDKELHERVFDYIESKELDWFSTPSHSTDVDMLDELRVPAYKIGSDDAINLPFLKYVAKKNKPIILATGMCTLQEIRESVSTILGEGNDQLILLHAITAYPTHSKDVNLLAIKTMINEFPGIDIGYSDHTIGTNACICAAVMGARVVEKHFTYDKSAEGPDHILSASPKEMKEIVDKIREFEIMCGNGIKKPALGEKVTRVNNRKSIVASIDIRKGEVLTENNVSIKRPGSGIEPKFYEQIIGKKVNVDISKDQVLDWCDFN